MENVTWITNGTAAPFYARKEFAVDGTPAKAVASVCGLGQFHFYLNGNKVGDHELDPAWTDYNKLTFYVNFDVTDLLRPGKNALGAEVGSGWYHKMDEHYTFHFPPFMPPNPNPYKPYGSCLVLGLELVITYEDGRVDTITADESFQVKPHPVVMSNVYGSETIDGRLTQAGWSRPDFDASGWEPAILAAEEDTPKGELMEQFIPPVKVVRSYEGTPVGEKDGKEIYDFSQNMSGILEFEVRGHAGDTVNVYPAEKLTPEGDVDQMAKGWLPIDSCITYIVGQDDVWETCRMTFTYFAGRFVGVEKVPAGSDSAIEVRGVKGHAITSAYETDGSFTCDDERYNQIYDMIEKTVEANMIGVHTDCPQIERFAWQEPNHLMAPSIFYMKKSDRLWEKFLLDMRKAQHTKEDYFFDFEGNKIYPGDGLMPSQCPCYIPNVLPVPGMGSFYDIIAWGSTSILGTWWHYQFYGDVKIVEDNYEPGKRYLEHLKTMVTPEGFINHGLGDWGNPSGELARENVETAFLYADAVTLAKFAKILGKTEDEAALMAYAQEVKDNYNEKLLVQDPETGKWCYRVWEHQDSIVTTMSAEALPLYWGLVPAEREDDVVEAFRAVLLATGGFASGEVGLPYIIQTARRYGMNEIISQYILKPEHPSYYAFILDGETTLGEYWEQNPRSHCHDMMGHIIEWYYNGIAGLRPEAPGFAQVVIQPYLPESIHEFTCRYRSVQGTFEVAVKEKDGRVLLRLRIPDGVQYRVDISNLEARGDVTVQIRAEAE